MAINEEKLLSEISRARYLLGYFSFDGCQVCKVLKPKVQELLMNYPEIEFIYIDTEKHPLLKGQYLVFTVPTIILFMKGREQKRFSRHISLVVLEDTLQRMLGK